MALPHDALSQVNLERMLRELAKSDHPPLVFYPNAVRYFVVDGKLCWELVELSREESPPPQSTIP